MSESLHVNANQPRISTGWATAKITDAHDVRRFINRLDTLGFEYQVVTAGRQLQVLVRNEQLEEVLGWFGDLKRESPPQPKSIDPQGAFGVLFALAAGLLLGSSFCGLAGIPSPFAQTISGYCGLAAALLVYGVIVSRSPRQSRGSPGP